VDFIDDVFSKLKTIKLITNFWLEFK